MVSEERLYFKAFFIFQSCNLRLLPVMFQKSLMKDKTLQRPSLISAGTEPNRSPPAADSFRFNGMALEDTRS